jgi:hypothetical protein
MKENKEKLETHNKLKQILLENNKLTDAGMQQTRCEASNFNFVRV